MRYLCERGVAIEPGWMPVDAAVATASKVSNQATQRGGHLLPVFD